MYDTKEHVLAELAPLFAEARAKGLWFHSSYAGAWFSPDDLDAAHKAGQFVWGATNWELRDPQEFIDEEMAEMAEIAQGIRDFEARMKKWKETAK